MLRLVLMGAGGHCREVLDVLESSEGQDAARARTVVYAESGTTSAAAVGLVRDRCYELRTELPGDASHYLPAVGDPTLRRRFADRAEAAGLAPGRAVSPLATVPGRLLDTPGLVCFPGSFVSTEVAIGRHTHLNLRCQVSHDVRIGEFVTLGPGALLTGAVVVEAEAFVGAGAVVLPGRRIGRGAVVGAGAVVVADVAPGTTVVGNPARPLLRRS